MDLLVKAKLRSSKSRSICIGDQVYYLKPDGDKFWLGCTHITEIIRKSTRRITAYSGNVEVDDVFAVVVAIINVKEDGSEETYKLLLREGEFTYKYSDWLHTLAGTKKFKAEDQDE